MTKPELGIKRDCPSCGARFYDLCKSPAHCPKCEHQFTPEALLKPRKRREDEVPEGPAAVAKPAAEAPLSEADKENKAAKSNRKPGLDDEPGEAAEGEDIDIADIEVEIEDDDDDTLLEDDEDDDEVGDIVGGGGGEEV
ncbi:MAG: TIGR02300 family protein [Parvularculaceae bacterium]